MRHQDYAASSPGGTATVAVLSFGHAQLGFSSASRPSPQRNDVPRQPVPHQDYAASSPGGDGHSPRVELQTRAAGLQFSLQLSAARRPVSQCGIKNMPRPDGVGTVTLLTWSVEGAAAGASRRSPQRNDVPARLCPTSIRVPPGRDGTNDTPSSMRSAREIGNALAAFNQQ
jgi:hypothetical protein